MQSWQVWVVVIAVPGAAIGLGRWVARRAWRHERDASGWSAWHRTAVTLSVRDRAVLFWSTTTGRPVTELRLAPAAEQRRAAAHALLAAVRPQLQRLWIGLAVVWTVVAVANVVRGAWILGCTQVATAVLYFFIPWIRRVDERWAARRQATQRRDAASS